MGSFARKRLGDVLVEAGAITEKQLQEAMTEQLSSQKRIGQVLLEKHFITEEELVEILEAQLGIPQVNLYSYNINPDVATSIPLYLAKRHLVVPIERQGQKLKLAMADPMNIIAIDDVAIVTGLDVIPVLASESSIIHTIDQLFSLAESLERDGLAGPRRREDDAEIAQLKALVEEAPIVKVVNSLIHQAVSEGASDIHIEPSGKGVRVRMRIDGFLHDLMTPPKETQPLLVSRIKIMSNLDISEKRLPQDGRITIQVGLKDVNMRVSTMPTIHGEKVVIRILDKDKVVLPLDKLGFSEQNYALFTNFLLNHSGMILVTGPTGSGKTTTLYSALNYLNKAKDNIITVEDPVEYRLDGINQVQVNPRINLNFANALRTILRQDPDVIMIGEIRDLETAEMATRAALTGHLVLSTVHTNDACSTINRLMDMGVENFLITSSLVGVVAQRLVRRICAHCLEEYAPDRQEQALFRKTFRQDPPSTLKRGKGCRHCNETGYRGRFAIHELLALNREIVRLILDGATADVLRESAIQNGMVTLLQDGLRRIEKEETTLEEVVRTAYSATAAEDMVVVATSRAAAADGPAADAAPETFTAPEQVRNEAPEIESAEPAATPEPTPVPALSIENSAPAEACAGETVTVCYTITNTGEAPLQNIVVRDPLMDEAWSQAIPALAAGERTELSLDYAISDSAAGDLESAPVAAAAYGSTTVEARNSITIKVARPELAIEKIGPVRVETGDTIEFQFCVVNTGNVPLSEVAVTGPLLGENWTYTIGDLPEGGISNFNMEIVVPEGMAGLFEEQAAVGGRYGNREITAVASCAFEVFHKARPAVAMEISGPETAAPGDTITYRFMVTNSGTVPLTGVRVTAPLFGKFWCNTIGSLATEKPVRFTFSYTVPEGTISALENTAIVSGWSGSTEVSCQAAHTVIICRQAEQAGSIVNSISTRRVADGSAD